MKPITKNDEKYLRLVYIFEFFPINKECWEIKYKKVSPIKCEMHRYIVVSRSLNYSFQCFCWNIASISTKLGGLLLISIGVWELIENPDWWSQFRSAIRREDKVGLIFDISCVAKMGSLDKIRFESRFGFPMQSTYIRGVNENEERWRIRGIIVSCTSPIAWWLIVFWLTKYLLCFLYEK